ncbi:MAG: 2-oxoacid:acceptor oxidoreductase subunit alpha [Bacteroidales bacterium]|nr:2-oxoacid:acceptor oxidoreductase subunit alpha [Bacteroidales bacterium]MBN2758666.1 2-oxoacid:acceptor oxidoreductase subunit alpha [Bacteroidales bacterium]
MSEKVVKELDEVVIKFSGDSGDGMQLTGTQFSDTSALFGNDIATFPDYPAEIRAPQGTVGGVSGFQLHIGHKEIHTPGDYADVLIAMNPAALSANLKWVKSGGTIILDIDTFTEKNIKKAGCPPDPLKDQKFGDFQIIEAPISSLTQESLKDSGLDKKSMLRSKNMFALGMVYWIFNRPLDYTEGFFEKKFGKDPKTVDANKKVLRDGFNFANTIEALRSYRINPAKIEKGRYRNINGNVATAWGFLAAAEKSKLQLFIGSYPITPATDILQELAARKDLGVKSFQAEDEIAGICTAIGASFTGSLAITTTSGPGLALKSEAIGLAVITELPLVIVDVQRGGPSTGLPTKTEQSDLFQALYGRNGESPLVVVAASTPSNCFHYAYQSSKIALEHMTPVILLTDGFIANGTEPWRIPAMKDMDSITPIIAKANSKDYQPYRRDAEKLVREWAVPGTEGLEHRIGGLEKMDVTGNVSYVPENHAVMTDIRDNKIKKVANYIPEQEIYGDKDAEICVIGWGGTYGHLYTAVQELNEEGKKVALVHFNYIKPLPKNTKEVLAKFKKHLVCELNLGQFVNYLRMSFPEFEYSQYNKVQGLPFTVIEIKEEITKMMEG